MLKYIFIVLITLGLDQFSKKWILLNLPYHNTLELIKTKFIGLNFFLTYNTGIAFGLFNKSIMGMENYVFSISTIVAIIIMLYLLKKTSNKTIKIYLLLIISGALGNFLDRILYHHVIDFIDVYIVINQKNLHWYVFNFADSLICIGTMSLIYYELTCKLDNK